MTLTIMSSIRISVVVMVIYRVVWEHVADRRATVDGLLKDLLKLLSSWVEMLRGLLFIMWIGILKSVCCFGLTLTLARALVSSWVVGEVASLSLTIMA